MEFHAHISYLRIAPRKVRLVAGLLRGKRVDQALHQLQILRKGASTPLRKLLLSAVANASQKEKKAEDLFVQNILVNEGPRLKRYRPRAFGRAAVILKRSAHVDLVLTDEPKNVKKSKLSKNVPSQITTDNKVEKQTEGKKPAANSDKASAKKTVKTPKAKKAATSTSKKAQAAKQ